MSRLVNATDIDPGLASAIGRFSQACVHLERTIEGSLSMLLPLTIDLGRVLFSGNSVRVNLRILDELARMPEVPLDQPFRDKISALKLPLEDIFADRNRFLHNIIVGGDNGYVLIQHRPEVGSSSAMPVSVEMIDAKTMQAQSLAHQVFMATPRLEYDLSQWEPASRGYALKPYPKGKSPAE